MRVGRYEVISHLATGGMAQIFLARQTGLGSFERHVVLKTIVRERASDQRFVTMFLDEAKLAATLNHQNVAQVYEVDQADGAYFMAMEYVHGENARAIIETTIRRGWTFPRELALMIVSGAAAGLHHAHERRGKAGQPLNIVHRDVSPANIMVGFDGSVKVLDFGIAKAEERITKTVGGTIKGKYGYMSPEQCKGLALDRRSDIFALGIVLYELTTLRRAFKGKDDFETMKQIVMGDYLAPSEVVPDYPRELEKIVMTAMANHPDSRYQTAQDLIEALDEFAVREKLTGSNTSLGRYMVQLFGTKKEPWVDGGGDHTAVSAPIADAESPTADSAQAPVTATGTGTEPDLENQQTVVAAPRVTASRRIATEMGGAEAPRPAADAAAWSGDDSFASQRVPRRSSQRPAATPDSGVIPRRLTPPAAMQVPARPSQVMSAQPLRPAPEVSPAALLAGVEDVSQLGAKPLFEDTKLGWDTVPPGLAQPAEEQPHGTRLASEDGARVGARTGWLVLSIVLVLGVAAAIAVLMMRTS
jgi:serine/threonine protein kinase